MHVISYGMLPKRVRQNVTHTHTDERHCLVRQLRCVNLFLSLAAHEGDFVSLLRWMPRVVLCFGLIEGGHSEERQREIERERERERMKVHMHTSHLLTWKSAHWLADVHCYEIHRHTAEQRISSVKRGRILAQMDGLTEQTQREA
jgi:hypothetical protein